MRFKIPFAGSKNDQGQRPLVSRRGVVLLMVVVLLVLLALIATAFLATARIDRSGAAQNTANTQLDMLAGGVQTLVNGLLTDDLFGISPTKDGPGPAGPVYRPPTTQAAGSIDTQNPAYGHWDGYDTGSYGSSVNMYQYPNKFYLASRHPLRPSDVGGTNPTNNGPPVVWTSISYPLVMNGPLIAGQIDPQHLYQCEDPVSGTMIPLSLPKNCFQPTTITYGVAPNQVTYPALQMINPQTGAPIGSPFLAADTDGDGIADAVLWPIPGAPQNGLTYFAAVRIIDDNSALNLNTAYGPEGDAVQNTLYSYPTWFPGSIDLQDLLVRSGGVDELDTPDSQNAWTPPTGQNGVPPGGVNAWRFNMIGGSTGAPSLVNYPPMADVTIGGSWPATTYPVPYARSDFFYVSLNDALWNNVGRRPDYPAYLPSNLNNPIAPTTIQHYHAFDFSDSMALARGFCLRPFSPTSNAEVRMPYSMGAYANSAFPVVPYAPGNISSNNPAATTWFNQNFDWFDNYSAVKGNNANTPKNPWSMRTMVVGRNPTSNAYPAHVETGSVSGSPLPVGVGTANASFANATIMPAYPVSVTVGSNSGYRGTDAQEPVKACLNTSNAGELWRAFWNVMVDDDSGNVPSYLQSSTQGVFRNPIRIGDTLGNGNLTGANNTPYCTMLLRAALAAQNVGNLRDGLNFTITAGNNPSPGNNPNGAVAYDYFLHCGYYLRGNPQTPGGEPQFHICLPTAAYPGGTDVTVFGYKPQPFITEVYANSDETTIVSGTVGTTAVTTKANPYGYIAIELYNPYPFEIDIGSCTLEFMTRTPPMTLTFTNGAGTAPTATDIGTAKGSGTSTTSLAGQVSNNGTTMIGTAVYGNGTSPAVIPPYGWLVLENYSAANTTGTASVSPAANYRPVSSGLPLVGPVNNAKGTKYQNTNFAYVKYLGSAFNHELVLLRGPFASVTSDTNNANNPNGVMRVSYSYVFAGNDDFAAAVPLDQIDLTGFPGGSWSTAAANTNGPYSVVHYVRANPAYPPTSATPTDPAAWRFVYPGHYSTTAFTSGLSQGYHQEGMEPALISTNQWSKGGKEPPIPTAVNLGGADPVASAASAANHLPIQLEAPGWGARNQSYTLTGNAFPFGGFARTGDMLNAPFIGAYTIQNSYTATQYGSPSFAAFIELNSVTMDTQAADDLRDPSAPPTAATAYQYQNIGRFVPCFSQQMPASFFSATPTAPSNYTYYGDYQDPANPNTDRTQYRYQFAMRLYDYFAAIQNPQADYTPNVSLDGDWANSTSGAVTSNVPFCAYAGGGEWSTTIGDGVYNGTPPVPVPNGNGIFDVFTAGTTSLGNNTGFNYLWGDMGLANSETTTGIDGLINVNTASWKVLACVPLVPNYQSGTDWVATEKLAQKIVYFRDINDGVTGHGHGPFKSLFELNMVPGFYNAIYNTYSVTFPGMPYGDSAGDFYGDANRNSFTAVTSSPNTITLALQTPNSSGTPAAGSSYTNAYRTLNDWEMSQIMVTRLSNLLTTRSDTYTAYLQIQAWQNVGTPQAQMVAQRRAAFIADRSSVVGVSNAVPTVAPNKSIPNYNIPNN